MAKCAMTEAFSSILLSLYYKKCGEGKLFLEKPKEMVYCGMRSLFWEYFIRCLLFLCHQRTDHLQPFLFGGRHFLFHLRKDQFGLRVSKLDP